MDWCPLFFLFCQAPFPPPPRLVSPARFQVLSGIVPPGCFPERNRACGSFSKIVSIGHRSSNSFFFFILLRLKIKSPVPTSASNARHGVWWLGFWGFGCFLFPVETMNSLGCFAFSQRRKLFLFYELDAPAPRELWGV